jgi:arginine exporter protein ArgO
VRRGARPCDTAAHVLLPANRPACTRRFLRRAAAGRFRVGTAPLAAVITALVAGLLAGWAIAIPVGAIGVYLIGLTASSSLRVGAAAALGVATVDGSYALVAVFGGRTLVHFLDPVLRPLRILAAVVLIVVAARGIVVGVRRYRAGSDGEQLLDAVPRPRAAYFRLAGLTLVNPATVVYFVAVVVGSRSISELSALEGVVFALAAFLASASWQLSIAGGGAALGRVLTGPRGRLTTALASGALIAAIAASLVVSGA